MSVTSSKYTQEITVDQGRTSNRFSELLDLIHFCISCTLKIDIKQENKMCFYKELH